MAGSLATVLICDDEPSLRELIRVSLDGPYQFAEADDGEESLEMARRLRPDLVILDMMMPRRNGLEVLTELRRDADLAQTAVIVRSARARSNLCVGAGLVHSRPARTSSTAAVICWGSNGLTMTRLLR